MFDAWCQATCNQPWYPLRGPTTPSNACPRDKCTCANGESDVYEYCSNEDELSLSGVTWRANPGTTATDAWCESTCTNNPPNCPCTLCLPELP